MHDSLTLDTPAALSATRLVHMEEIGMNDSIALNIQSAYKTFGGPGAFSFASRGNGHATPTVAVNRVSFQVKRGEICGVRGPNGCGKSTLSRVIATLLMPDGGQITVFGHDVAQEPMAVQKTWCWPQFICTLSSTRFQIHGETQWLMPCLISA